MTAPSQPALRRELRLWHVVLFNISAVAGVRWLAAAAHGGPGSLALWLVAAVAFFLPSALVVAGLTQKFPQEGGLYNWTKQAFGEWHGFLCAWLYFVSNICFFPTLLLAGVAVASYMFGPAGIRYSEDAHFGIPITFAALWLAFLLNMVGMRAGKWATVSGAAASYLIAALLIGFGIALASRYGSPTHFHLLPQLNFDSLNFWSQIAFAFVGLEVAPILGGEIDDTGNVVRRAAWISGIGCAAFYMAGTAAMLALMPPGEISPLTGLAQAGQIAGARFGVAWLTPAFALLIILSMLGQLTAFVAGNTRLPFALGLDHHLPPSFAKLHPRWGTPHVSILLQGVLSSVLLLAMQLGETLRAAYQILVDLTVIATFLPFVYIFASGFRFGQRVAGLAGLAITILAIVLSAVPPTGVSSVWVFELKVVGGAALLALAAWPIYRGKWRTA
ncbi:MAG TPA: APC family permease [Bryobacteraceae bacterium]|nr:APC family permease [Bryobacteraceae bacterium]